MAMSDLIGSEITDYSEEIAGDRGNHNLPVRFDRTDGYVGITQGKDRVLLTPRQMTKLRVFLGAASRHRRSTR